MGQEGAYRLLSGTSVPAPTVALHRLTTGAVADGGDVLVRDEGAQPLLIVRTDGRTEAVPYSDMECGELTTDGKHAWMFCGEKRLVRISLPL